MPVFTRDSLDELVALLKKFIADDPTVCQLRRATLPNPPDKIPPLNDTASNNLDSLLPLNEQFSAALTKSLAPGEKAYTWALLPQWLDPKKGAQALVITERRIFLLPDHSFEIPLTQIAALEYTSSILESSLAINFIENGSSQRKVIFFPYPAQGSFRACFEAARRCMAALPLA